MESAAAAAFGRQPRRDTRTQQTGAAAAGPLEQ